MFTVRASDFDFQLPTQLVAQRPAQERQLARLLVLQRAQNHLAHAQFSDFPSHLHAGDVLVLNDSKVLPARLRGKNHRTGGAFEILLLEDNSRNNWWAMLRPGKRARVGTRIDLVTREKKSSTLHAIVTATNEDGHRRLQFFGTENILDHLDDLGEMPLPPYIKRDAPDPEDLARYQTIYAQAPGSVAAPTAGLHFTPALLEQIRAAGIHVCHVTLHVGPGTFAPVKTEELSAHTMHEERWFVPKSTAACVNAAKAEGRRVIAVGTTSVRVLESASFVASPPTILASSGRTRIFIHPPHRFRIVDALLTNFHLPRSTLLMLVSAFAAPGETRGRDIILAAYHEAIARQYRFFSYGDAMFIE